MEYMRITYFFKEPVEFFRLAIPVDGEEFLQTGYEVENIIVCRGIDHFLVVISGEIKCQNERNEHKSME
jgi:hypothetical protein